MFCNVSPWTNEKRRSQHGSDTEKRTRRNRHRTVPRTKQCLETRDFPFRIHVYKDRKEFFFLEKRHLLVVQQTTRLDLGLFDLEIFPDGRGVE